MSRIKKRLTHNEYMLLHKYIEEHAIDGAILLRRAELAQKATEALGFHVSPPKASRTAKDAGVDLIRNEPRRVEDNTAKVDQANSESLVLRLTRIEEKMDRLCKCWEQE